MKDEFVKFRLSERDKGIIKERAEQMQMSMSEYLIYLVRKDNDSMNKNRLWYAVQKDTEDDWSTGSFDLNKAKEMLLADDELNLIAVIDNNVCIEEIYKNNL